ncbi:class I SAM-dependent methyltransferase [Vulgatibacter sp.]|uniref:class I SAM-dependent methyltransferase n=1 Tax=Vulgatibacter sp. TaxID=1971226 RepID=UPI003562D307
MPEAERKAVTAVVSAPSQAPSQENTAVRVAEAERSRVAYPLCGADGTPWFESYFGADYGLLYPDKDAASGDAEAKAIVAALAMRPGARVLDVGCGTGRHAIALARRGCAVTALDRSAALLGAAAAARDEAGVALELRLGDMRTLPLPGAQRYDAVLSLFTSFGYFSDGENEAVAKGMAASLLPGGRLLLDLNNRELLEKAHGTRTWTERPGGYLLDEFAYDADARRFLGNRILLTEGRERRYPFDHRAYSEPEIRALLKRSGLRVLAVYGSLERTPFNARASRMVVLAEKP